MSDFHIAILPVGKLKPAEVESSVVRAAKVLRQPIEVREGLKVPRGSEDIERGQHRAATFMQLVKTATVQTNAGKMVGGEDPDAPPSKRPDAFIYITDVDLFTAKSDGVFAVLDSSQKISVISVRRLREAFYRRKADPSAQRSRLSKEILRMAGRLKGLKICTDPKCVLAPSKSVPDLDSKIEMYCRPCAHLLFEGKIRV